MPSRRTNYRVLVGLWIALALLYLLPAALLGVTGADFGISVGPGSNTKLVFVQLIILLLVPWATLLLFTWRWRRGG